MKTDERDEHVCAWLDDAVRDMTIPLPDIDSLIGAERPPRRFGTMLVAAAVAFGFVSVVIVAGSQFGGERPGRESSPSVRSATSPGWRDEVVGPSPAFAVGIAYPREWKLESYDFVWSSNVQPVLTLRSGLNSRLPACAELEVIPGEPTTLIGRRPLGPHEFVIAVQAYTGGGVGLKEPRKLPPFFPRPEKLAWDDAIVRQHACGRHETSATFFVEEGGRWIFHVAMGSGVMRSAQGETILRVLDGVRLPQVASTPVQFLPAEDWLSEADAGGREDPVSAWTSNVEMTADGTFPALMKLPDDGVLLTVAQVGDEPPAADNPNFPPAELPLTLPEELETSWEGHVADTSRHKLWVAVEGRALDIAVYYGTTEPSDEQLAAAEAALERLVVTTDANTVASPTALDEQRIGVYEAMIRKLVEPDDFGGEEAGPIIIRAKLCSYLGGGGCSGQIRQPEQEALAERLGDLGPVQFVDGLDSGEGGARSITLLGPIRETPDGLRVEGGYWCGGKCAGGDMYIVEQVDSGYRVVGKDLRYGSWIS